MNSSTYRGRIEKCATMMKAVGCDVLLLTKPSNMNYRTGDGRLCAYAMIATGGCHRDTQNRRYGTSVKA
jgi:Xaa-Pro aminopeptidase